MKKVYFVICSENLIDDDGIINTMNDSDEILAAFFDEKEAEAFAADSLKSITATHNDRSTVFVCEAKSAFESKISVQRIAFEAASATVKVKPKPVAKKRR